MKIIRSHIVTALALLFVLAGMSFLLPAVNAAPPKQQPPAKFSAVDGESVFVQNCVPCHGTSGKGDGPTAASIDHPLPDFTDPATLNAMSPSEMFTVVKEGRMDKMMPPWKNRLNDTQIWAAVAYLLTLNAPDAVVKNGEAIYTASCASCHNADGVSADVDLSAAESWVNSSTDALLVSFKNNGNTHESVLKEQSLSDADAVSALAYARSLSINMPVPVPHDGVLFGKVTNGTTGEPMGNVGLILYVLSSDGNVLDTVTGSSAEDGTYTFENLQRDHSSTFVVEAVYNDIQYYSSDTAVFLPDSKETTLDVNVYDTTDDPSAISATTLHRLVAFVPDFISITDIYVYQNTGDKTYIGKPGPDGQPETVRFMIPDNAQDVTLQFDTSRQLDDVTYADSRPIIPGGRDYSVAVSYGIPIKGRTASVKTKLVDNIPMVNLLMAAQGADLDGPDLTRGQDRTIQGQTYRQFTATDVPAGKVFEINFSGLNKVDFSSSGAEVASGLAAAGPNQRTLQYALLALGAVLIGFVVFVANRTQPAVATAEALNEQKERYIAQLLELETMHENGEIDNATYRQLRTEYRDALKNILALTHD